MKPIIAAEAANKFLLRLVSVCCALCVLSGGMVAQGLRLNSGVKLNPGVRISKVAPAPTLISVTPNSGTTDGGTSVVLAGANFVAGATVTFGGAAAGSVSVVSSTVINAVTPAHAAGVVDVTVTIPAASPATLAGGFAYVAPPASTDRYVSNAGSDSAAGTQAAPWATIAYAAAHVPAGGTIYVAAGTYAPALIDCAAGATQGTALAPIALISDSERQAYIAGDSSKAPLTLQNCNYWTVQGFRIDDLDSSNYTPAVVDMTQNNYVTFRRNLLRHPNRYWDAALIHLSHVSNALLEENEFYEYHSHAIISYYGGASGPNVFRRNYCNSRGWTDLAGSGYSSEFPEEGDQCIQIYGESNAVLENNISEGQHWAFEIICGGLAVCNNNKLYGNIAADSVVGFILEANSGAAPQTQDDAHMPHGTLLKQNIALGGYNTTAYFSAESAKTTTFDHNTALTLAGQTAFQNVAHSDNAGDGNYSATFTRDLAWQTGTSSADKGFYAGGGTQTISGSYINAYGYATPFTGVGSVTNQTTSNPQLSTCKIWRPDASWAKTNDLGADILYRYENGTLTSIPLWANDGSFPHGAVVTGWNDTPWQSLFDLGVRFKVGSANGCAFPSGYGSGEVTYTLTTNIAGTGSGSVVSTPVGINCGGVCQASFDAGTSVQLDAAAGTNSTFSSWTGCASTSGTTCYVTMDAAKSVTATFASTATGDCASGTWTDTNPMPASCTFYGQSANGVTARLLPADILSHLATNSDVLAANGLTGGSGGASKAVTVKATPGSDDLATPLFYGHASDPVYNFPVQSGGGRGCQYTTNISIPNFHAPNNVPYTDTWRTDMSWCNDGNLRVWDQATGAMVGGYHCDTSASPFRIGQGGTLASPANFGVGSGCGAAKNALTDQDWGRPYGWSNTQGAEGSALLAPMAGVVRNIELTSRQINHALILTTSCSGPYGGSNAVFPASDPLWACTHTSNMPPNGALLFCDYTDAQIAAMNIAEWKKTVLTAFCRYGGYVSITARESGAGAYFQHESGIPYQLATGGSITTRTNNGVSGFYISGGTKDPVFAYLASQGVVCGGGSGTSDCKYSLDWLNGIPNVNGTGVLSHVHMADPCVAKGYAGEAGGCS